MKKQKMLLRTIYCLAGLLFIVSIGVNVFQYQRFKKFPQKPVSEKITKNESISDSNSTPKSMAVKIIKKNKIKNTAPDEKEEKSNTNKVGELEYHLNAAKEELDMTKEQLSEELSKKAEFKKISNTPSSIRSDPYYIKMKRDVITRQLDEVYEPLFNKLNISEEDFNKFKDMVLEATMELESLRSSYRAASSAEEKEELNQQSKEIVEKHNIKISELFGEINNEIYNAYENRRLERRNLSQFIKSLSPDNKLNEEQREALIDSMYEARETANSEMGTVTNNSSSSELTEETIAQRINKQALVNERYVDASSSIMTPEQIEQYKAYLKQQLEMQESSLKMRLYLNDNN